MENNLERYRLTRDEYYALRTIFGLVSSYELNLDKLLYLYINMVNILTKQFKNI